MFCGARLKLDRANKHIFDIQGIVGSLKDRYTSVVEIDKPTGGKMLKYECPELDQILIELSLIIGDAVHNTRSSLDHAWVETLTRLGLPTNRWAKFPFSDTPQKLNEALESGKIQTFSPTIYKWITSDVKPYPGGNDCLYALHKIDIMDKHKLLIPVVHYVGVNGICVEDESGKVSGFTTWNKPGPVHIDFLPNVQIHDKGEISVSILFNQEMPLARGDITDYLSILHRAALGIIDSLSRVLT